MKNKERNLKTERRLNVFDNPFGHKAMAVVIFFLSVAYGVSFWLAPSLVHNESVLVFRILSFISFTAMLVLMVVFSYGKLTIKMTGSYITLFNIFYLGIKMGYIVLINYDTQMLLYFLSSEMIYAAAIPMFAYTATVIRPVRWCVLWFPVYVSLLFLSVLLFEKTKDPYVLYSLLQLSILIWLTTQAVSLFSRVLSRLWRTQQDNAKLQKIAYQDELTGLLNRRGIEKELDLLIEHAHNSSSEVAVIFSDLDGFKPINDTLGHELGDEVLKISAERFAEVAGGTEFAARISSDEFVLLIPMQDNHDLRDKLAELKESICSTIKIENRSINLTISTGVSIFPKDGYDVISLIRRADIAMSSVKSVGKNGVEFYGLKLHAKKEHEQVIARELTGVHTRGEMSLSFQPIYDVATGHIHSCEALLRWQHPTLGAISPAQFIPLAESSGTIVPIGHWIITEALSAVRYWREKGLENVRVAVNISPLQLLQDNFVEMIHEELEKHELSGEALELEITEGLALSDRRATAKILDRLHQLDIQLSLDDFGEGFASLSHLRDLPLQIVKLDRSFVMGLEAESVATVRYAKALIHTAIYLANTLGLKVVAEGVETREQYQMLCDLGCHYAQGYYFMYPTPLEQLMQGVKKSEKSHFQFALASPNMIPREDLMEEELAETGIAQREPTKEND